MSIFYCYLPSPVGKLLMLEQQGKLTHLDFELEQAQPNPQWILAEDRPLFQQVKAALNRYFAGEHQSFQQIPLAPQGTAFQQAVWTELRNIPYGQTLSYGQIAKNIGNPKAIRAVGGAVGRNPISIIIPCHRILGQNQALTGFGGGLAAKRYLLQLEGIAYKDQGVEFVKPKLLKKYQLI